MEQLEKAEKNIWKLISIVLLWLLTGVICFVLGGVAYWWIQTNYAQDPITDIISVDNPAPTNSTVISTGDIKKKDDIEKTDTTIVEVDTIGFETYINNTIGISFKYPKDWVLDEETMTLSKGNYKWNLEIDPVVDLKGFGYMFDGNEQNVVSEITRMKIADYDVELNTHYVDLNDIKSKWGGSVIFSGEALTGFGEGMQSNEIENDYFGINYSYDFKGDYDNLPSKDSSELKQNLQIMNDISESFKIIGS